MSENTRRRALALFSGGLDSILAARLVMEQGIAVSCLHFITPFFGFPEKVSFWRKAYGLDVRCIDIGDDFARLLAAPAHGFGSVLNPCVDCKILMMRHARRIMEEEGAICVISGEVLGQRPMSQRRDTLNVIRRDAELKGKLLRPLCALHLEPTEAEEAGLIDRERLLDISGRGRGRQLELAARWGITDFPQPSGGCRLTEQENARSYWPVLAYCPNPSASDFHLANTGRQFWHDQEERDGIFRLAVGRKQDDNQRLMELAGPSDMLFKVRDFPGPIALGRGMGRDWSGEALLSAASFVASYCPKAAREAQRNGQEIAVRLHRASLDAPGEILTVRPERQPAFGWREFPWEEAKACSRKNPAAAARGAAHSRVETSL